MNVLCKLAKMTSRNEYMYEGATCKRCGVVMGGRFDGIGWDRPAEIYAGTYTGLCDKCMYEKDYTVKEYGCDAKLISVPPDCPSWRRNRKEFIAYSDCETCKGSSWVWKRSGAWGERYKAQCETCWRKYYDHPRRMFRRKYIEAERLNIVELMDMGFNAEAKTLGLKVKLVGTMLKNYSDDLESDVQFLTLREKYVKLYSELTNKLREFVDREYPEP
jgi:hypothetical protein